MLNGDPRKTNKTKDGDTYAEIYDETSSAYASSRQHPETYNSESANDYTRPSTYNTGSHVNYHYSKHNNHPTDFRNPSPPRQLYDTVIPPPPSLPLQSLRDSSLHEIYGNSNILTRADGVSAESPRDTISDSPTLQMPSIDGSPASYLLDNTEEIYDPLTMIIDFNNRFTKMKLSVESLSMDTGRTGFYSFFDSNRKHAIHCWQKQIGCTANQTEDSKVNIILPLVETKYSNFVEEKKVIDESKVRNVRGLKSIKIEEDDDYSDKRAQERCRRYLRGKSCKDNCAKLHRLPKEDGVKCISQKLKQCHQGRKKCNFVHDIESSDDEDSDGDNGALMEVGLVRSLNSPNSIASEKVKTAEVCDERQLGLVVETKNNHEVKAVKKEQSFSDGTCNDPRSRNVNSASGISQTLTANGSLKQAVNGIVKIKEEPVDLDANHENMSTKSSRSCNSSITTITTSTTVSKTSSTSTIPSNSKKRQTSSAGIQPPMKKERLAEPAVKCEAGNDSVVSKSSNNSALSNAKHVPILSNVSIKEEPLDAEQLFKEETVEAMAFTSSLPPTIKCETVAVSRDVQVDGDNQISKSDAMPNTNQSRLKSNCVVSVPQSYQLATVERLSAVTEYILQIADDSRNITFSSEDSYTKLCEYLEHDGIPMLSELDNSKLIVWDIHIRLFFTNLLGTTGVHDYLDNIDSRINDEDFETFLRRTFAAVHTE